MSAKQTYRIKSTGQLCVKEGTDTEFTPGRSTETIFVRVIDSNNYELTSITRNVNAADLETI